MIDIVFISFQFPPLNVGGVFRPQGFAELLPEENIRPHVYCLKPECYGNVYGDFKTDESLAKDFSGKEITIHHVPIEPIWSKYKSRIREFVSIYFNLYRGNEYKKWEKPLIENVLEDHKKYKFKAILVTAPPFGMLRLANKLSKKLKIPFIIDMRDAWAYWNTNAYGTYLHYYFTLQKEKKYFNAASRIIATSEQTIKDWNQLHPEIPGDKFVCITNGFDNDSSIKIEEKIQIKPVLQKEFFKIVYVGSFYYSPDARRSMLMPFYKKKGIRKLQYYPRKQDWLYRSPYFFFQAISKLFQIEPSLKSKIKIIIAGSKPEWLDEMINDFGLREQINQVGFLNHNDSLRLQNEADALLMTSAKVYGGNDCFIAGKTFEYMVMNKPIFSFVAQGAQKDILTPSGLSINFNPDDADETAKKLHQILINGMELNTNENYIRQFDRRCLTQKLALTIKEAIGVLE